jgi:hypothetical protein
MANKVFNEQQKVSANARKVITGEVVLSYCNLNAPKSINGG